VSSIYLPGYGGIHIPPGWMKPCAGKQWNNGVLAVDWPPIGGFSFFETPAGLAPDGEGGVFLLSTGRQLWLNHTGGSYTLRHVSAAGAVSAALDFLQPITDVGALGPEPQAAVVPSGSGKCIVLWGWHQNVSSLVAQRFDTSLKDTWGGRIRVVSPEPYRTGEPSNLVAEPDGNGGAVAAWWAMDPAGTPACAARAGWVRKTGTVGWPGGVTVAPAATPTLPASWLQIVPRASAGEAIVVVPETMPAGTMYRAYSIDLKGNLSAPAALAGPVPDAAVSYLRTRSAVTDGKDGLYFGYVDANSSLHVLRFRPSSGVLWDVSLGTVVNMRAFHVREDESGGVLVTWVSVGASPSFMPRVELKRLSTSGAVTWDINAAPAAVPLPVLVPPGSAAWLPDDWARLAQAVPNGSGGAILVFEDFPGATAKLFSACFDSSGVQKGAVEEVSQRTGPQELALVAATAPDSVVTAWSDESSGIVGSQVWANRSGCCSPMIGLPYPIPFPCEIATLDGSGFGDLPFGLPCGDETGQYGVLPLMRLTKLGVNLPGCVGNRASPAPAWMRLSFLGLPSGTSIQLRSSKGKVLAKARRSRLDVSLTFAPSEGAHDLLLVFERRGARRDAAPIPVRVEGSWGEGKPPAIVTPRTHISREAGRSSRRARSRKRAPRARSQKKR
jgi:hypothetical protein